MQFSFGWGLALELKKKRFIINTKSDYSGLLFWLQNMSFLNLWHTEVFMLLKLCSAYGDLHMQIRIYRLRLGSNCQFRKKSCKKKYQILIVLLYSKSLAFLFLEERKYFQTKKINPFELRQTKTSFMFQWRQRPDLI